MKIYIIVIVILLLIYCLCNKLELFDQNNNIFDFNIKENRKFPFRYFKDANNKALPIVALTAFFRNDNDKQLYYNYVNNGIHIIGVTAYKSFPLKITHDNEDKYHLTDNFNYYQIKNWLCCFTNKEQYGFTDFHNIIDISESDFYDIDVSNNEILEKKYDFIYICNKDDNQCSINGWNAINRNYELALKCFPIMINKYNLKGLAVGRIGCNLEKEYGNKLETTDFLNWHDLQNKMKQSKFLFVPNIHDASPRVVSECLIKNIPILMNKNILCGSKYITDDTGILFENEYDFDNKLYKLLSNINTMHPQKWWISNYGISATSIKLRNFLYNIYPDIIKYTQTVSFII